MGEVVDLEVAISPRQGDVAAAEVVDVDVADLEDVSPSGAALQREAAEGEVVDLDAALRGRAADDRIYRGRVSRRF